MTIGLDATGIEHVTFAPDVLGAMLDDVNSGFGPRRRHEAIGMLFGRVGRDSICRVEKVVPYATWFRSSTWVAPNPAAWTRRAAALARRHGLRYLGAYHSHPQLGRERVPPFRSAEDDEWLWRDRAASIDVLVRVWRQKRTPARRYRDSLYHYAASAWRAYEISCCGMEGREVVTIPIRTATAAPRKPRHAYRRR
ncbi:MAG TPA: Mov34/MPN/PAD-1 family protein [Myxococcota bacterium]|jgi:proteasome lid subunit RPN8/RPN11|nr:Mov34/MPN/PAD-1 family protein [Myxococcota bacterium]